MEIIIDKLKNFKYSIKERLIGLKTKSISGTSKISLSDASGNNAIAFGIKGNSIQETREGYNHYVHAENLHYGAVSPENMAEDLEEYDGYKNVVHIKEAVGYCTFMSDKMSDYYMNNIKAGDKVTVLLLIKHIGTATSRLYFNAYTGEYQSLNKYKDLNNGWGYYYATFKFYDDATNFTPTFHISSDGECYIAKLQVAIGDEVKDFEPYGASPSHEFTSEIESVSGRNIFNVTEFEANLVSGKILNDSGEEISDSGSAYSKYKIPVKANQSYHIKGAFQRVYYYDSDGIFVNRSSASTGIDTAYTPTENGYIGFQKSDSYWNANKGAEQVEKGTVASPFIPYNHIEIKSNGKNSFDKNNLKEGFRLGSDGNYFEDVDYSATNYFIKVKPNTQYTTSWAITIMDTICLYDIDFNFIRRMSGGGYTFTTSDNEYYARASVFKTNVDIAQIEQGEATDYEPYKGSIVTFPLADGQKLYKDSYLSDDGIHHKRGQIVLDGSENWGDNPSWNYTNTNGYIADIKSITNANIMSNYYKYNSFAYSNDIEGQMCLVWGTQLLLRISNITAPTRDNFKALLREKYEAGTPVIVECELAEEEIIPYTSEQQEAYNRLKTLAMFKGVNNIEVLANIEPSEVSIAYYSSEGVSLDNYKFEVKDI